MGKDNSLLDIFTDDVEVDLKRVKPWQRCELFIVILKVEMRRVLTVILKSSQPHLSRNHEG